MKKIIIGLTVITLLSIVSVSSADRGDRHDRLRVRADYDSPFIVKLFFGSGRHSDYRAERHRPRQVEKRIYKERGPYGEKVVITKTIYKKGNDRPYWKKWKRHRHDRNDWRDRH